MIHIDASWGDYGEFMATCVSKKISHKEKAYRYVKEGIISRIFLPGNTICERSIAALLGISRTPVREAMQTLQEDGWLTILPRRGTIVRELEKTDIEEVFQLRLLLGEHGVEHAARKAEPADLSYLRALLRRQEEAARLRDSQAFMVQDMELHLTFVRFADNGRMYAFAENLSDYFQRLGMRHLALCPGGFQKALEEHKKIVDAIAEGDPARARALLAEHVLGTQKDLLRHMAEGGNSA